VLTYVYCFILAVIDRTALFVARSANPLQFEDKIREGQRSDPKFSFLNPVDPYHAYYRHRMTKIEEGEEEEAAPEAKVQEVTETAAEAKPVGIVPLEPHPPEFILDLPPISAADL
jgi:splicing factor 3A subunit 1